MKRFEALSPVPAGEPENTAAARGHAITWMTAPDGTCTFLSDGWYDYTGQQPEEGLGYGWIQAVHEDDRAAAETAFASAYEQRIPARYEYRLRRRDGVYRWAVDSAAPRFGRDGEYLGHVGFVVDVHDRRDIEAALRLHAELLAHTHDAVIVWELPGTITYWNHGAQELYGYAAADAAGKRIHDLLHTIYPIARGEFDERLARHGSWEGELTQTTRDGTALIIESRQLLREHDGRTYVMEIDRDVTERSRTENELRRSEAHLRLVADHAPVFIAHLDRECRFKYVNEAYAARFGATAAEVVGYRLGDLLGEAAFATIKPYVDRVLAGESVHYEQEVPFQRLGPRVMECFYEPERGRAGDVRGWIAVVTDVTARHRHHEEIRESERRFRELADSMPQIVFTARPDGTTDYFNKRWYELTGLPDGDTREEVWSGALHPDDRERCLEIWYAAVRSGTPYQIEYRFKFPAFEGYRWHLGRALPARDGQGRITRWYGTCTDIHDHRLAQDGLRDADRRKDEFLAMLAHELRNPLAPIRNAVRVLNRIGPLDSTLIQMRDVIDRQTDQLTRLVDDLLDVSRITQGKVTLRRERLELLTIVARAVEMVRPVIDARRHHLAVTLPPEPIRVEGDLARLAQVLANLLSNAAKYTSDEGHIWLEAEVRGTTMVLRVRDDGQGIPTEFLDKVFDLFVQVDRAPDRAEGGLGIGLTLVRKLVEMHGGRVSASSEGPGRGSEFVVELPVLEPEASETEGASRAAWLSALPEHQATRDAGGGSEALRVLVVDDNVDAAETIGMLLELDGHRVQMAHDGHSATATAAKFAPHVVLLDIGLPGRDGYEVARMLRAQADMQATVLIAVTGYGMDEDRQRARNAGFDHHLTKPVDPVLLSKLIASLKPS